MVEPGLTALAPPPAGLTGRVGLRALRPLGRIRCTMYGALVAMMLGLALLAATTWRLEVARTSDIETLDRLGEQRGLAHQLASLAALLSQGNHPSATQGATLAALLQDTAVRALPLEYALSQQMQPAATTQPQLKLRVQAWQAARDRLRQRGLNVLSLVDAGEATQLRRAAQELQAEAGAAAAAAQALSTVLQRAGDDRAAGLRAGLLWGLVALGLLLLVLSLAVVEPTARGLAQRQEGQQQQAAELKRLALVAEQTSAMVLITDEQDRIQWANAAFTQLTGWHIEDLSGQLPGQVLYNAAADPAVQARLQDALVRGVGVRLEHLFRTRDGRDLWLDVDLRPLHDAQGGLTGFVSVNTDVSARVIQQAKLQALWNALPAGVLVRDADGKVLEANPAAERLLGASAAQLRDPQARTPGWRLVREDGDDYPINELPALGTLTGAQAVHNDTVGVVFPDGATRWLQVNTEAQRDAIGQLAGLVTCFSDITERRLLQDHLSRHASTDALTQLPNRAAVMERVALAIDHATRHPGYGFARCCSWTSTASSRSTTRWAMVPATNCCGRLHVGCSGRCALAMRWPGSAQPARPRASVATSLWSCLKGSTTSSCCAPLPTVCCTKSASPISWVARRSRAAPASALCCTWRAPTAPRPRPRTRLKKCCAMPTPPCTKPNGPVVAGG